MNYETILVSKEESFVIVTLNRPPLNLVNGTMLSEIMDILERMEGQEDVRSIILTGQGEHFCAGADVAIKENFAAPSQESFHEQGRKIVDRIEMYPKPMIAAVTGKCFYGGTGLAWPCDIRVAGENAKFRAGDAYLGIVSSWGVGMVRTAHYIGRNRALDIMIMGEVFNGPRAVELGIMSKVVPDDQVLEEARNCARIIGGAAPISLKFIKEGVSDSWKYGFEKAKAREAELVQAIYETEDSQEGLSALMEGREPVFKGR